MVYLHRLSGRFATNGSGGAATRPRRIDFPQHSHSIASLVVVSVTLACGVTASLPAQSAPLAGSVVDSRTGLPLSDGTVRVEGTTLSVRTNLKGEFRLDEVTGTVRLTVSRIGYQPRAITTTAGEGPIRIELDELAVKLDEVVVTGTPGEALKRSLGNVIGGVQVSNTIVLAGSPRRVQDLCR